MQKFDTPYNLILEDSFKKVKGIDKRKNRLDSNLGRNLFLFLWFRQSYTEAVLKIIERSP